MAARILGTLALAGTLALGVGVAAASADQVSAAPVAPAASSAASVQQSLVSPNGWDWWM